MAKRKTTKRKVTIQIKRPKKPQSGFHVFDEAALGLQTYGLILKEQAIRQNELAQVKRVREYLKSRAPSEDCIKAVPNFSFYRIVESDRNPLSCLGSFSCGGRVNMGTPQLIIEFEKYLKPQFGLYGSLEIETAREEYDSTGLPSVENDTYKLTHSDPLIQLFDFDKMIEQIGQEFRDFPLLTVVSEIPYNAAWKYQKSPKVSQIIGSWLKNFSNSLNVHGIIFSSTKRKGGSNAFLFFNDDLKDASAKLTLKKLTK